MHPCSLNKLLFKKNLFFGVNVYSINIEINLYMFTV
jgi:hypothetical protein